MSLLVSTYGLAIRMYDFLMTEWSDPKTRDWTINKPTVILSLIIPYLIICVIYGPIFMKNRQPYNIRKIIHVYNISQIVLNTAIFVVGLYRTRHYSFWCQPVDYSDNDPREKAVSDVVWWYTLSKHYDLLDTVFFVLRKNFRQITWLHLYHHVTMAAGFNFATNFFCSGMVVFPFGMNTLVHVVMYTYYFLAALGPQYKKYLWWKRHLTEFQLIQFTIALIQFTNAFLNSCDIPLGVTIYMIVQSVAFLVLFGNFYYNTYLKTPSEDTNSQLVDQSAEQTNTKSTVTEVNGNLKKISDGAGHTKEVNGNEFFVNGKAEHVKEKPDTLKINQGTRKKKNN